MTKVVFDTSKIKKDLVPLAQKNSLQISSSKSTAFSINFPYDSFGWGNIKNQIEDCANQGAKYYNWINSLASEYDNVIGTNIDEVNAIDVRGVRKQTML